MCKGKKALVSRALILRLVGISPVPFPACCQRYPHRTRVFRVACKDRAETASLWKMALSATNVVDFLHGVHDGPCSSI